MCWRYHGSLAVLQPGRWSILQDLATIIDGVSDLFEKGDEGWDAKDLSTYEQCLNPGRRYLHSANTIQDANDQLHILKCEAQIIGCQLLVQVNDVDTWLVSEEIFEVLAAAGEDHLVSPEHLALADQGDVHILASAEVLTQGGEHSGPLL